MTRLRRSVPLMLLSYVLRLVPSALAEGRLAGTLQTVDTGLTTTFSSVDELVSALLPEQSTGTATAEGVTIDLRDVQRLRSATERPD